MMMLLAACFGFGTKKTKMSKLVVIAQTSGDSMEEE